MAALTVNNLTKIFPGDVRAVDDFSLEVAEGELLVLVGPSGCGKTTLLRMIAGLETPTAGSISIDGHAVDRLPPKDRDLAMVFQHYALY
ncbi:MAG: ATP-binding cassette domain-containing protein, partial [Thermoguttaceae bacterium]